MKLSIVIPVSVDQEPPPGETLIDAASAIAARRGRVLVGKICYEGISDSPDTLPFDELTFHRYSVDTAKREV